MILYKLLKNTNKEMKSAYGKYYAYPVIKETVGITELAAHMTSHNTGFSPGQVKGILTDMVRCIKELVLQGVAVKIEDLAIFTLGIINKEGAEDKSKFTVSGNIESVKLRSRATGEFTRENLHKEANLADIEKIAKIKLSENETPDPGTSPTTPGQEDKNPSGGSDTEQTPDQGKDSDKGTESGDSGNPGSDDNQDY